MGIDLISGKISGEYNMKTYCLRFLKTLITSIWVFLLLLQPATGQVNPPGTGTNVLQSAIISVVVSDPAGWEKPTDDGMINFAQFTLRRSGNTNAAANVHIRLQGSAMPGLDYYAIPDSIQIPAGVREVHTVVWPNQDGLAEGDETVTLVLLQDMSMSPMANYILGAPTEATVVIKDNNAIANVSPVVPLTAPADNSTYSYSVPVVVTGLAEARNSLVQTVDFLLDGQWAGGVTNTALQSVFPFTHPLGETPAGAYTLTAIATTTGNFHSTSAPVRITIAGPPVDTNIVVGFLKREVYLDIPGITVADLTGSVKFPGKPDQTSLIDGFEAPMNVADNYGQRLSCYLKPPTDGDYVFHLASDDQSELWLSSDTSPENKALIATQDSWSMPREWNKPPDTYGSGNNRSKPITLAAGRFYYVEALMKEGGGGDHCAVAWQKPGDPPPVNGNSPIPGEYLAMHPVYLTNQMPVVNIDASTNMVVEGQSNVFFRISRINPTNNNLLVAWMLGGTASNGVDYVRLPITNTIPAGRQYVDVMVQTIDDKLVEANETIVAELIPPVLNSIMVGPYVVGPSNRASVVIRDNDSLTNQASLVITSPTEGATFMSGSLVPINVTARDPNGTLYRVEFYANDKLVGMSQIFTLVEPPAGTPMYHSMVWTNTVPGNYTLTAKATDKFGKTVVSGDVKITVQGAAAEWELHGIGVYSGNYNGGPSPNNLRGEALVKVNRPGKRVTLFLSAYEPVHWQVNVVSNTIVEKVILGGYYAQTISGLGAGVEIIEAFHGGNYGQILWAGYEVGSAQFYQTVPLLHALTGMELSSFQGAYTAPMPGGFTIDKVQDDLRLRSDYHHPNQWPEIGMLSPQEGREYPVNVPILFKASATDPDGQVQSLEFFVNDQSVGHGISLSSAQGVYALEWTPTTPGHYTAWAKATDNRNATSPSVRVGFGVSEPVVVSTAVRKLPKVYLPQTPFRVEIVATPGSGSYAYALQDSRPKGWSVSSISHDGVFDSQSGLVKFGPFFDATPRILSYMVTPPYNAAQEAEFTGQLSVDGISVAITGDHTVSFGQQYHPADRSPEDHIMSINEVTAYGAAWKKGSSWPVGPNPIRMDYVTRAGALWKVGETYIFSQTAGAPPSCWVNVRIIVQTNVVRTNILRTMAMVAENRIMSQLPASYMPGTALPVTLTVTPRTGVLAYAIEDQPPTGWTVSSISAGGTWDVVNSRVKWFFIDGQAQTLTYQATPPTNATAAGLFAGSAVFDDMSAPQTSPIQGRRQTLPMDAPAPRLGQCSQQPDGSWILPVISVPGARVAIEVSADATQWDPLAVIVNPSGADNYTDRSSTNAALKFYRARLEE